MAKRPMENLTESMFYVLMALQTEELCGIEIAELIEAKTGGRIKMGPGTLYTILGRFVQEKLIAETEVVGRKRTYTMTQKGIEAYQGELERLRQCLRDAQEGTR